MTVIEDDLRRQVAELQAVIAVVRESARDGLIYLGDEFEDYSMSGLWVFKELSKASRP